MNRESDIKLLRGLSGLLIIKGQENWIKFMEECGFDSKSMCSVYKIGDVEIRFSSNPHYVSDVIALD